MVIQVEFNPELTLRANGGLETEYLPKKLEEGKTHEFLKKGQRNYWMEGTINLIERRGERNTSDPIAEIQLEATHFYNDEQVWTKGKYHLININ